MPYRMGMGGTPLPGAQGRATTIIRRARPSDAAAIGRIHVETWRSTYAGILPDDYLVGLSRRRRAMQWRSALNAPGRAEPVVVAEDMDEGVVAFTSFGGVRQAGMPKGIPYDGEIFTLYVLPDHQGRGLGRSLLGAGFRGMARAGRTSAVVWVIESNPSRFFYERMGARQVAHRRESFAGTQLPELAYGWPKLVIGAGAWDGETAI